MDRRWLRRLGRLGRFERFGLRGTGLTMELDNRPVTQAYDGDAGPE